MQGQYFPLVPGSHIKYLGGAGLRHAQLTGATIIGTYCKFIGAKLNGARFIPECDVSVSKLLGFETFPFF